MKNLYKIFLLTIVLSLISCGKKEVREYAKNGVKFVENPKKFQLIN